MMLRFLSRLLAKEVTGTANTVCECEVYSWSAFQPMTYISIAGDDGKAYHGRLVGRAGIPEGSRVRAMYMKPRFGDYYGTITECEKI